MTEQEIDTLSKLYMKYYFEKYANPKLREKYQNNT